MPTYQVSASADDSRMSNIVNDSGRNVTASGVCSLTETILAPGSHGGNDEWSVAARFTTITTAQGATISSASFTLTAQATYNAGASTISYLVSAQASDNAGALTSASGNLNTTARPRTTAVSAAWNQTSVTAETEYSIDITSVIQEIVNRAGWASGNAIVILVDTNTTTSLGEWQDYYSYDGTAAKAPKLTITEGGAVLGPPLPPQPNALRHLIGR